MESQAKTVSDIVREDYRTADVFRKHGINYCCGSNTTLEEACRLHSADIAVIRSELEKARAVAYLPPNIQFDKWPIDFLVDFIINIHHAYLKQSLPDLQQQIVSFAGSHKNKYAVFQKVEEIFTEISSFLLEHTQEEEDYLFPYIKQIHNAYRHKESYGRLFVRTLRKPLQQVLLSEHKHIAALLQQLRAATNHYCFDVNACTNHQVIYYKLRELDTDLVQHKHLENNLLFPKAINMEKELLQL